MVKSTYSLGKNKYKRNFNRHPPKIVSKKIVNQYKDTLLFQCTGKSGDQFFECSKKKDVISTKWNRMLDIVDDIKLRNKLINSTSIDNYLFSTTGIKTSVGNRNVLTRNKYS